MEMNAILAVKGILFFWNYSHARYRFWLSCLLFFLSCYFSNNISSVYYFWLDDFLREEKNNGGVDIEQPLKSNAPRQGNFINVCDMQQGNQCGGQTDFRVPQTEKQPQDSRGQDQPEQCAAAHKKARSRCQVHTDALAPATGLLNTVSEMPEENTAFEVITKTGS